MRSGCFRASLAKRIFAKKTKVAVQNPPQQVDQFVDVLFRCKTAFDEVNDTLMTAFDLPSDGITIRQRGWPLPFQQSR